MTSKDYVGKLDWDSAIGQATLELETKSETPKPQESYLNRGIAHCFISDNDGTCKEAIEDLSKAVALGANEAYHYRAYAYYLAGNYERAIADCDNNNNNVPYKQEMLGKIYMAMSSYTEAVEKYSDAMKNCFIMSSTPSLSLMHEYFEACKKMNNV